MYKIFDFFLNLIIFGIFITKIQIRSGSEAIDRYGTDLDPAKSFESNWIRVWIPITGHQFEKCVLFADKTKPPSRMNEARVHSRQLLHWSYYAHLGGGKQQVACTANGADGGQH